MRFSYQYVWLPLVGSSILHCLVHPCFFLGYKQVQQAWTVVGQSCERVSVVSPPIPLTTKLCSIMSSKKHLKLAFKCIIINGINLEWLLCFRLSAVALHNYFVCYCFYQLAKELYCMPLIIGMLDYDINIICMCHGLWLWQWLCCTLIFHKGMMSNNHPLMIIYSSDWSRSFQGE